MQGSITVRLPGAVFVFEHVKIRAGAMESVLSVFREAPTDVLERLEYDPDRAFRYHLSGRSLSNVTAYRRELEKFHGADLDWGKLIHEAIRQAEKQHLESVQSRDPWEQGEATVGELVEGVFPLNQISCVFGMGGCGKSLAVESAMAAVSVGTEWMGRLTTRGNILWLDYENEHEGDFANRRVQLGYGGLEFWPGSVRWMPGEGVSLPDLCPQIRREMERFQCKTLVVDSVAFACGGDPIKAEIATGFYAALSTLPVSTKVLIAHTDKNENDKYPFGSIFWHNGIHGMSWFVKGVQGFDELSVGWYGRKVSNGPKQKDFATKFTFMQDSIFVTEGSLASVNNETGRRSLTDKIRTALADGAQTTKDLAADIGADPDTVRVRLNDMRAKGQTVKLDDGRWGLAL